eukprot:1729022-Rhodomonas_salina.1
MCIRDSCLLSSSLLSSSLHLPIPLLSALQCSSLSLQPRPVHHTSTRPLHRTSTDTQHTHVRQIHGADPEEWMVYNPALAMETIPEIYHDILERDRLRCAGRGGGTEGGRGREG